MPDLLTLQEPTLLFDHGQAMEDPRDGLTLFGPLDQGKPYGIKYGVVGTRDGIGRFTRWVESIQGPIANDPPNLARPPFPGFEAAFRIPWNPSPSLTLTVQPEEIDREVHLDDRHLRVYRTVDVYARLIQEAVREEEDVVDIWFVIIPEIIHQNCRPLSQVASDLRIEAEGKLSSRAVGRLKTNLSFFEEENQAIIPYQHEVDFHHQLKARLLQHQVPIQILRESTIAYQDFKNPWGAPKRDLSTMESAIAWNICTTAFYKAGGRPWKINEIREGVCYIGLVFKRDDRDADPRNACCAAQMFLDSGDGVVFKGAVGPWYVADSGDYHLRREPAKQLVDLAVRSYTRLNGHPPKELFIHGKVRFDDEEWAGFSEAVDASTNVVGVRIRPQNDIKLYRSHSKNPVLRGLAYIRDQRTAYLWSKGFVPRLQTYPGREVPNPLLVDVCKGTADINLVLADIMALTKLNYNACIFADGVPVTLKFADAVGEILTAAPLSNDTAPLPFRHYI